MKCILKQKCPKIKVQEHGNWEKQGYALHRVRHERPPFLSEESIFANEDTYDREYSRNQNEFKQKNLVS
jgi:hypothetical protein